MPKIEFASSIRRHLSVPPREVNATTVQEALKEAFASNDELRSYVLDDQGEVRKHVVIFVNDRAIADRQHQSDAVKAEDSIYVFQALSGG